MNREPEANFRRNRLIAALLFWVILLVLLLRVPLAFLWIILTALPALISPIRQRALASPKFLQGTVIVFGLLPFVYTFGYLVNGSVIGGPFSPYRGGPFESCFSGELLVSEDPQKMIYNELLIRSIVPPPISTFCYTGTDVCTYLECVDAETNWELEEYNNWRSYLFTIGISSIPAFMTSFFVRLFVLDNQLTRTLFFWDFGRKGSYSDE